MGVVDQALPARRRARLLEVHPHGDAQLARPALGPARPAAGRTRAWPRSRARCTGRRPRAADRPRRRGWRGSARGPAARLRRARRTAPAPRAARAGTAAARAARSAGRGPPRGAADAAGDSSGTGTVQAAGPGVRRRAPRPAARARAYSGNSAVGSDWRPSQIAASGSGWTSTMTPSAPTAAAASESGPTSSRRPAAWLGSTITGSWVRSLSTGTAARSSVKRYAVSKVRIPRSHRMTASLPSLSTYSAAMQQLVERAGQPALDAAPAARCARPRSAGVVLHVAGADLDDVGDLEHRRRGRARPCTR